MVHMKELLCRNFRQWRKMNYKNRQMSVSFLLGFVVLQFEKGAAKNQNNKRIFCNIGLNAG